MPENNNLNNNEQSSETTTLSRLNIYIRGFLLLAVLIAFIYLVLQNLIVFGNILIILIGFGAVVLVHEFGHFIIAKLSDIKVEAFSIFMGPIILGLLKTKQGLRIRILPGFFPNPKPETEEKEKPQPHSTSGNVSEISEESQPDKNAPEKADDKNEGLLTFTIGKGTKAGETEYRICLIPIGGFVKMLGQEDTGPSKSTDDPRSYANKPVGKRMAVISAGVFFNVLSAAVAFMIVFLIGIKMPPPVVGEVMAGSPAEKAGIKPGDEIVEINGKTKNLDFSHIALAAAFLGEQEKVRLKVKRNGKQLGFTVKPDIRFSPTGTRGGGIKGLGIRRQLSLTIANVAEPNKLQKRTGLLPGDKIIKANGKNLHSHWQLKKIIEDTVRPYVTITAERKLQNEQIKTVNSKIDLNWLFAEPTGADEDVQLSHICSMVPRLKIAYVEGESASFIQKVLRKIGLVSKTIEENDDKLKTNDIILGINDVQLPTYKELREVTEKYKDKKLNIKVLRINNGIRQTHTVQVKPEYDSDANKVMIGIIPVLDTNHPVVAKTIETPNGPQKLNIPRGALITSINGKEVANFYDIAQIIQNNAGGKIAVNYKLEDKETGHVTINTEKNKNLIAVMPLPTEVIPFKELKRTYKATGPIDAVIKGASKTVMFINITYLTLKGLIAGQVSPKNLIGPIGILTVSYNVVTHQPFIYYVYWMALISACIAVLNFLPILPFDGGHVVLLLIEKVKGSAISERTQGAIAYMGVVLLLVLILYVTFNDIMNFFIR